MGFLMRSFVILPGRVEAGPMLAEEDGVTTFMLAADARMIDHGPPSRMVQRETGWCEVNCGGELAGYVAESVAHGDRVIVCGELGVNVVGGDEDTAHVVVRVEAVTVGHDLRYGVARFLARSDSAEAERASRYPIGGSAANSR